MTVQEVHSALLKVWQTIREHATTSMQKKADDYRKQATQRSAKYTARQPTSANSNDEDDEDDTESEGIYQSFKLQHRQLARLQICALKVDANVAAAKALAQELSQPITTQFIDHPDSFLEDGEELHTKLEPQLTLALSLLDKVFDSLRLAATKLLVSKLQTLTHTHAIIVSSFWVAHETDELIRNLVDHQLRKIHEAIHGKLVVNFLSFDSAHHRQGDGDSVPTNVQQLKPTQRAGFGSIRSEIEAQAGQGPGQNQHKNVSH